MSDEPIINEDLEALLYAQVYYGKEQNELSDLNKTEERINTQEQDQVETTSGKTGFSKNNYQRKRYFQNNLVNEDKEKNTETFVKESNTDLTERNSVIHSTSQSNAAPEITEKSPQGQDIHTEKDQGIEASQHQFIQISTSSPSTNSSLKDSTQIVTTTVVSTPSESSHPQLLNNITINQYLIPSDFEQRLRSSLENNPLSKKCKSDLNKLKKGHISEQQFFNNLKRRLRIQRKQQNEIRKAYKKRLARSEVICLSDSDSSDIEVVEVISLPKDSNTKNPVMQNLVESCLEGRENHAVDDDEIVYVAPPPVPVINIDSDSDSDTSEEDKENSKSIGADAPVSNKESASQSLPEDQPDIDETSDDFLQPKNTPENFNFSLHGSDFQNTEFVRPANPTDVYETESSTSTSDFNRDSSRQFCNSVKTIVFNEVEFPNQDIFDGSNLESFGEFITPKRANKEKDTQATLVSVNKLSSPKASKRVNPRASSESSSESEYEGSTAHQNLPVLSPMVCAESSPKKRKTDKKNASQRPKKNEEKLDSEVEINTKSSKKKVKFSDRNVGILDVSEPAEESVRKSKRKSSGVVVEEVETPRKKTKKKKNKSGNKGAEDNVPESSNDASDRNMSHPTSPKKRSNDSSVVLRSTPSIMVTEDKTETSNVSDKSCRKKKKKTKKNSVTTSSENEKASEDQIINENNPGKEQGEEERGRNRNKKLKQKESSESRIILEVSSSTTHDEIEPSKGKDTGTEHSSINKSSGEQEVLAEEQNCIPENNNKKKNKRKKKTSKDKSHISNVENESIKDTDVNIVQDLEEGEIIEDGEDIIEKPQNQEGDVILIEKVIPVHIIDSSESDEDILTLDDVGIDLQLANTSGIEAMNKVIDNRDFDVDYIQRNMSDDPEKWKILPSDQYQLNIPKKGPRCNKCRRYGHISINCPNKPGLPVCTLCGGNGHQEPRCPNKVCFTCGKPGSFSTVYCYMCAKQRKDKCNVCYLTGHRSDHCSDLWRRYFLTTSEGPLTVPKRNCPALKPRSRQWCSGCASNGHLEFECNTYKWIREYPVASPRIFKYKDVYEHKKRKEVSMPPPKADLARITMSPDPQRTQFEKFVAKTLQIPMPTPTKTIERRGRRETVAQCSAVPDKNLEGIDSQQNVTAIEANLDVNEYTAELLSNRNENRMENQQPIENQPAVQAPEYQSNNSRPEIRTTYRQSNQISYNTVREQPNTRTPFPERRSRALQNRKSSRNGKINPVSVLRPTGYTPYHSVLNPYSILGAPDVGPPESYHDQLPANNFAQQLVNLASTLASLQDSRNLNQSNFNFPNPNQTNFCQFGAQIPPNPTPLFDHPPNVYQDFSEPFVSEPYQDWQEPQNVYRNRDFLNRPHTITRDSMEEKERFDFQSPERYVEDRQIFVEDREGQKSLQQLEDEFQERPVCERSAHTKVKWDLRKESNSPKIPSLLEISIRPPVPGTELPMPLDSHIFSNDFVPLESTGQENVHEINKFSGGINVDETTTRKFYTNSNPQLKELISKELGKLDVVPMDVKIYRRKLNNIYHLKKIEIQTKGIKKQMYYLFKQINVFLFGVHKLGDGNAKLDYLRNFAFSYQGGLDKNRRKALLIAYGYIFGGEHSNFDYRRNLNTLTVMNKK